MNKTIYLRDEEVPVWERARELADDKLSPVIVMSLRQFVAAKEAEPRGFTRIVLNFNDADDHYLPKSKAFYGRWIISLEDPYLQPFGEDVKFAVAVTARGNAVFYRWTEDSNGIPFSCHFDVYPSLERAAAENELNGVAREAIERIGVPTEELDI